MSRVALYNSGKWVFVETFNPIGLIRKIFGYTSLYFGISTLPLPTGSIFFIIIGCFLIDIPFEDIKNKINAIKDFIYSSYDKIKLYGIGGF